MKKPAPRRKAKPKYETLRWWPLGEPLPKGWKKAPHQKPCRPHSAYSVLLVKAA